MSELEPADGAIVDALWKHLRAAFGHDVTRKLTKFVNRQAASKWIIAADFCIRDVKRPNDSFAFVILPAGKRQGQTDALLKGLPSSDLKSSKRIDPSIKRALTKGNTFTICFVADRDRRLYATAEQARASLDRTLEMMRA